MNPRSLKVFLAATAFGMLAVTPSSAMSQEPDPNGRPASVQVVLVRSLPPGAAVVVQRGHGGRTRNLILVTESTTTSDLATALSVLRASRERDTEEADRPMRFAIPRGGARQALRPEVSARLDGYLVRIREAAAHSVDGVGTARSITIALPALQDRGRRPAQ